MTVSTHHTTAHVNDYPAKLRSSELLSAFEKWAPHIKVLSLDCFDTLIWRQVAEPRDVFYDVEKRPAFKSLDITALVRMNAEVSACNLNKLKTGTKQASL